MVVCNDLWPRNLAARLRRRCGVICFAIPPCFTAVSITLLTSVLRSVTGPLLMTMMSPFVALISSRTTFPSSKRKASIIWFFSGSDWLLKNNVAWLKWSKKLSLRALTFFASILFISLKNHFWSFNCRWLNTNCCLMGLLFFFYGFGLRHYLFVKW